MNNLERMHIDKDWNTKYNMNVTIRDINNTTIPPHWHDYYELEIVLSGEGTATVNSKIYPMSRGSLFFLTPKDFHYFSTNTSLHVMNFAFATSCLEYSNFTEMLPLYDYIACSIDEKLIKYFQFMVTDIKEEIDNDRSLSKQYTSHLLSCILITLSRISKTEHPGNSLDSALQKILYYVHAHFKEQISLDDIASFTGYSKGHICRIFKSSMNFTFKEYITNLRLTHAEQLLMYTSESISDIAYFCGFSSLSHFLNIFKQKHKISPRSFRKENKALNNIY